MMQQTVSPNIKKISKVLFKTVLNTGLLAGILDAIGAIVTFLVRGGKDPVKIFNFIASGVFGTTAFSGGLSMAFLGLIFHLLIAIIWTILFFIVYPKIKERAKNWVVNGLVYGVIVWLGMNFVVVPLSNTPPLNHSTSGIIVGILVLMVCIGLPISFNANRYFR